MTITDTTRPADGTAPDSGHTDTPDAREGLRGLLGERYEAVIEAGAKGWKPYLWNGLFQSKLSAMSLFSDQHADDAANRKRADARETVADILTAILPDLLAEERRLGRAEGWARGMREQGECSNPQGACARRSWDCKHPNPYRTEGNAR